MIANPEVAKFCKITRFFERTYSGVDLEKFLFVNALTLSVVMKVSGSLLFYHIHQYMIIFTGWGIERVH